MRAPLSRKLAGFGTTIFTEMTRLANEHGAINLAQGFPDFDGPDFVKQAAVEGLAKGFDQYARSSGSPAMHAALARYYRRHRGLDFAPEGEFVVGCGATELIFASIQAVCDVGDEVVLFEPFYDSYRASVCMAGAVPRVVTLHAREFRFDPSELRRAFSARTRAVIVNTPHNPTGRVFTRGELSQIAALCEEFDAICISDEVYEHLVYEGEHVSMASLAGMRERTITLGSLSKTFSLTGFRVGWAAAPEPLARAVQTAHQFVTFAAPSPLQHAAARALDAGDDYYDELRASYRSRRDMLAGALTGAGFELRPPEGAYFICAGIERFGFDDDVAFCRHLTREIGVAAIPPSAFYEHASLGASYVRFTFCKREDTLAAAAARLGALRPRAAAR